MTATRGPGTADGAELRSPNGSLVRASDGAVVATSCEVARTFVARFLGLMGRASLPPGGALWIEPCSSIHMMFMRFRIDAVFVDASGVVLKVSPRVLPWIGLAACHGARATIEVEAGAAARVKLAPGDHLVLDTRGGAPPICEGAP
jgi:uncharacterized membrane protein (UPF0127 family)